MSSLESLPPEIRYSGWYRNDYLPNRGFGSGSIVGGEVPKPTPEKSPEDVKSAIVGLAVSTEVTLLPAT